jgi:hypothetical protein
MHAASVRDSISAEPNKSKTSTAKCLRHQLKPTDRVCALCDAKKAAKGKFEAARRIFVNRK